MIRFENINLVFQDKRIFHDLDFHVRKNEKVVLTGRSGLGKSSVFGLILGFVRPGQGRVVFDGMPVDAKSVWQVRRRIAFVDQDVSLGQGRVRDWMDHVAGLRANTNADFSGEKVRTVFEKFSLESAILDKDVSRLSGGERQRVALVTAVLLDRSVFLLDEVTSGLDEALKKRVVDFFCDRPDWTVVAISHDKAWTGHPAVRVFNLEEGAV